MKFPIKAVPIPRATAQFQVPENRGTADIIMQAAQLSQQAELQRKATQQAAFNSLGDAIMGVLNLQERREHNKMQMAQAEAMMSLKETQSRFVAELANARDVETKRRNAETERHNIEMEILARERGDRPVTAINPITGEESVLPKGARFVTPPGAVDAQKNVRTAENLLNILEIQERKIAALPKGRVYGNAAIFVNRLTGAFPDVGVFQGIHEATIPVFSRVVGGDVGNLAEKEQTRAAKINPSLIQTADELRGVIAFTKEVLRDKISLNKKSVRGGMFGGGIFKEPPVKSETRAEAAKRILAERRNGRSE